MQFNQSIIVKVKLYISESDQISKALVTQVRHLIIYLSNTTMATLCSAEPQNEAAERGLQFDKIQDTKMSLHLRVVN